MSSRLPCYVFCICMLTNIRNTVELGDQLIHELSPQLLMNNLAQLRTESYIWAILRIAFPFCLFSGCLFLPFFSCFCPHPFVLFYFVPQDSHRQAGSSRGGPHRLNICQKQCAIYSNELHFTFTTNDMNWSTSLS